MFVALDSFANANPACPGCQDGIWAMHMVNKNDWAVRVLPLTDMRKIIFHGPSPLWCIASGNVWVDHPTHTTCVSHRTAGFLLRGPIYDSYHFFRPGGSRTCVRLSKMGFDLINGSIANAQESQFKDDLWIV